MTKAVTILAVVANLVVSFYAGRRSFGATAPYEYADVVDAVDECEAGTFVGGCKSCGECNEYSYAAGGCTYFKDTFCTLCEAIKNCPQINIRCTERYDNRCLQCDPGFYDDDCKPCKVCEAGEYESAKCTHTSDTVCTRCAECMQDHFTHQACTYFTDTICARCTHCNPYAPVGSVNERPDNYGLKTPDRGWTRERCQLDTIDDLGRDGVRGLSFPESIYNVAPDTVCKVCTEPQWDGPHEPEGIVWDELTEAICTREVDTGIEKCWRCPCRNRPFCEFEILFCEPGDSHTLGEDTHCQDCDQIRGAEIRNTDKQRQGAETNINLYEIRDKSVDYLHNDCLDTEAKEALPQDLANQQCGWNEPVTKPFVPGIQWEVFRCGGTSDALFKPCTVCQRGEYEEQPCTQTSDTVCPVCNLNLEYGLLNYCLDTEFTCTTWQDTSCDECQDLFFGETCCYHLYHGSCGTMSTRERIPRRLGYEGETNEEFIDFCLMLCDEFPDCMAFEVEDGGVTLFESGMNSFEGKMAACYFKSAFSQDDEGGISDASAAGGRTVSGNGLRGREHVFRGEDPSYDCYSNVCRQNGAFPNAYQLDARISDNLLMATELEGTQYQAGAMTRRMGEGYPGGSSSASRAEFRRMMEKGSDAEGLRQLSAREKYIEMMKGAPISDFQYNHDHGLN
jgi:hypothetical protein